MRPAPTRDQELFRRTVRDLLAAECTPEHVREGPSRKRWRALADVGVTALTVPEWHEGLGMGAQELVGVLEEAGYAGLPEPLLESVVAARALADVHPPTAGRWLPRLAAGDAVLAIGLPPAPFVAAAEGADLLLLGHAPGGRGVAEHGSELHALDPADAVLSPHRSIDPARRLSTVEWTPDSDRTLLADGCADALGRAFRLGALGAAAQLVGVASRMLDLAVQHAGTREQFGRPVGAFQAVKHQLADVLIAVEFTRPVVLRAAYSYDHDLPSAPRDASMAKVFAAQAADRAARSCLQVHGAIGYTEEHDLQLWLRRAWTLSAAWGDAAHHRARVAGDLLGPRPAPSCPPR